jgi:hypothetical protein
MFLNRTSPFGRSIADDGPEGGLRLVGDGAVIPVLEDGLWLPRGPDGGYGDVAGVAWFAGPVGMPVAT